MDIRGIINDLKNRQDGPTAYYKFESLILTLLQKYAEKQSKNLITHYHYTVGIKHYEFDAFAPEGLEELEGSTIIELKLTSNSLRMRKFAERFINVVKMCPEVKNLFFIIGTEITKDERKIFKHNFNLLNDVQIKIWDLNDLSIALNDILSSKIYSNINSLSQFVISNTVSNSLKKDINYWKDTRNERINELRKIYKNDDLVLFLGAGISKKAGISDWKSLISELMVKMIEEKLRDNHIIINKTEQKMIVKEMNDFKEYSPLLQASYIKTGLGDNFEKEVSKALYSDFNKSNKGTSALLKSLAKLCIPRRSGVGIKSVVTYNFDDLLEVNLEEQNIFYKSIYNEMDTANVDELAIYHVHGFIPRDPENHKQLTDSLLVFSEEGYHILYNDAYSWPNIVQLNYLRESTCLMVGLSMTDPNLRRLLSIATRKFEEPKHFVIMKRQSFLELSKETNIRKDTLENFTVVNQELQESFFKAIGVNIIWVDEYDEIPQLLDSIVNVPRRGCVNEYVAATLE
ncbi:hypothetical protein DVV81_09150 [Clostridium botulinum]|uniref:SIR2 family protein n=1 Tax=Clostridium botulinum TaxID=1491 RepID=UPI0013FA5A42|nr:SIR2 family protein [Clostridium botulinum]MBN1071331.1 hypothetical protein [Clostridium botulinum]NFO57531.1 hypothetical protein [Clostridium botulinum]